MSSLNVVRESPCSKIRQQQNNNKRQSNENSMPIEKNENKRSCSFESECSNQCPDKLNIEDACLPISKRKSAKSNRLVSINLSGCWSITDFGLR
jgi:hypothetical protein